MRTESVGRETLNSSWNSGSSRGGLDIPWEEARLRGRFYDEYREKRETKLREEHAAKRAEKEEAKLKAMQELEELEQRKAEITGKSITKSPEKKSFSSQAQSSPQRPQSPSKTKIPKNKKEQNKTKEDDGESTNELDKGSSHRKGRFNRGAPGELLCPNSPTNESSDPSKSTGTKKNSFKNISSPIARTSKTLKSPLRSPSPKPAKPRVSSTSNSSTMKRLVGERSLSQSMSNLADVKKNTKSGSNSTVEKLGPTSSVQNKGNNKINRNTTGNEACEGLNLSHYKEEKKNPNQSRKDLVGEGDSNSLSLTNSVESSSTSKSSSNGKVSNKSSAIPLDSKPFLRKGSGIGPGSGRVTSKVKSFSFSHSSKPVEDEVQACEENIKERVKESRNPEPYVSIGGTEEKKPDQMESDSVISSDACGELYEPERNMQSMPDLNLLSVASVDFAHQNEISNNVDVYPSTMAESSSIESHGEGKEITSSSKIILNEEIMETLPAAAFLFDSPPLIHSQLISSGLHSELVKSSSLKSHKLSFSQIVESDTDAEQSRQRTGTPQQPIRVKDAPKGLKRFLNFGRRNRSKTTVLAHSVSASNLPEGDGGMGSLKKLSLGNANDILQRDQVQAKDIILRRPSFNKSFDLQSMKSSVQSSQSDIQREEDLTGASVRKVPRSLFALSSFRSKGSNSKSR